MSGNVKVVARFRPPNSLELREGSDIVVDFSAVNPADLGEHTVKLIGSTNSDALNGFTFDRVFPMGTAQRDVFEFGIRDTVDDVVNGYNGTIFAYGQTGSGKTFTMMGSDIDDENTKGIIPRITEQIFESIMVSPPNLEYFVKVSYLEIYMEKIRDLLQPQNDNLQIHEDKARGVYVKGLTDVYVGSTGEVYEIMRQGSASRVVSYTNMNAESSRSHSIFVISIQQRNTETGSSKTGNLYLVDLAGSEKVGKTGASGQTLEEAKKINKSLSALGMVINALTDGKSGHIPYRDSKLTRILQESLGGNSRTTLIVNASPCSFNSEETLSTLRFGVRAKSIKNKARVNAEMSPAELRQALKKTKAEADRYKAYIAALEAEIKVWRAGGKVAEADRADASKLGGGAAAAAAAAAAAGGAGGHQAKDSTTSAAASSKLSAPNSKDSTRPTSPAVDALKDLASRPDTPTVVGLDKDERDEFLRRENELADQVTEKEAQLKVAQTHLAEVQSELSFLREQEETFNKENKALATEMNEVKLELERIRYDSKDSTIMMDMLKEQNAELTVEVEELKKNLAAETAQKTAKDAAQEERKERKKQEKMAKMLADFSSGILTEREEQVRATLLKLETTHGPLSKEDMGMVREQLLESQTLVREQQELLKQAQEENDLLLQRREETELRLSELETEYEELIERQVRDAQATAPGGDVEVLVEDLKSKLEIQYASKRQAQANTLADLQHQLDVKAKEVAALRTSNEELKNNNEELKRAFAITAAGVEGGKNLAESAREMERVRKTMANQLAEFDVMKRNLMRDLQNRCEKVVELELSLDESKEQYNNVLRSSNARTQQKKMAFLERQLEQLVDAQQQLVAQNAALKTEVSVAERKLVARQEHIRALEASLTESQNKLAAQNRRYEQQMEAVRTKLAHAREARALAPANPYGRIAKPLRGGGGGAVGGAPLPIQTGGAPVAVPRVASISPVQAQAQQHSRTGSVLGSPTSYGEAGSLRARPDAGNSIKSRSNWFFSTSKQV